MCVYLCNTFVCVFLCRVFLMQDTYKAERRGGSYLVSKPPPPPSKVARALIDQQHTSLHS